MSSPARTIDINDPRLTEQELDLNPTAIQKRLQDLSMDDVLQRFSNCRAWSKYEKCEKGHIHCRNSARCGYRLVCANCSCWDAKLRTDKYRPLGQFIQEKFLYATIVSPETAGHESLRAIEKRVSRFLRSIRSSNFRERTRAIFQVSVTSDKHPEVRILCADHHIRLSQEFHALIQEKFPGCTIDVTPHLSHRFAEVLRMLTAPVGFASNDPYRVDLEEMFQGIRAFHVLGFKRVELSVCNSKEKADTTNSTEIAPSAPNPRHICKVCGHKLVADTRWHLTCNLPKPEDAEFRDFHVDVGP